MSVYSNENVKGKEPISICGFKNDYFCGTKFGIVLLLFRFINL